MCTSRQGQIDYYTLSALVLAASNYQTRRTNTPRRPSLAIRPNSIRPSYFGRNYDREKKRRGRSVCRRLAPWFYSLRPSGEIYTELTRAVHPLKMCRVCVEIFSVYGRTHVFHACTAAGPTGGKYLSTTCSGSDGKHFTCYSDIGRFSLLCEFGLVASPESGNITPQVAQAVFTAGDGKAQHISVSFSVSYISYGFEASRKPPKSHGTYGHMHFWFTLRYIFPVLLDNSS